MTSLTNQLWAQQGNNPFEIKARLQNAPADTVAPNQGTDNPFDLNTTSEQQAEAKAEAENPFELAQPDTPEAAIPEVLPPLETDNPFEINQTEGEAQNDATVADVPIENKLKKAISATVGGDGNFLFWTILAMLFLTTFLFSLYRSVIIKAYRAFSNDNFLKLIHRDQGTIVNGAYMLLYIAFIINAGIFLLLVWRYFGWVERGSFGKLLIFIGGVAGVFIAKHIMLKVIEYAFPVSKEVKQYSFMIVVFSIILGLVLVPVNVVIAYAPENLVRVVIYAALLIIILVYLFRAIRSLFLASSYISFHKFHFFMYLCAVEIAPALVMTKLLLIKAGIH